MRDGKRIHLRIVEPEKSKTHRDSADTYFLNAQKADVKSLLTYVALATGEMRRQVTKH